MVNFTASLMFKTILFMIQNDTDTQVQTAPRDSERCYGLYGCFSVTAPWISESRPIALFPFPPDVMNVRFPTFTRKNLKIPNFLDPSDMDKLSKVEMNPNGPFFFISHGYLEGGNKLWVQKMTEALLTLEENADGTVIGIDWRGGSSPPYTQAVANIRLVGVITAHLIHDIYLHLNLKNLDNFHVIGHSLGAHVGGYVGYTLRKHFGLTLGRITGLDPAEPHFGKTENIVKLDRSDAKFVDIIHSDASQFISGGLGILESIGHVDFFPNGGAVQPGCNQGMMQYIASKDGSIFNGFRKFLNCNHVRAHEFFQDSILSPCPFMAAECASYQDFLKGACMQCGAPGNQCLPFGYHSHNEYKKLQKLKVVSPNKSVKAYLMTSDALPFCRMNYRVTVNISASMESSNHGGDVGRLWMVLVSKNGAQSDRIPLEEHAGHHKPGTQKTLVVSVRDVGIPESAIIEWEFETNLLNPLTWRILMSPRVYIAWVHIESMEYNTKITVCPQHEDPLIANTPNHFQKGHCNNISHIKITIPPSKFRF